MGTDVYLKWKGMTKKEEDGQITGYAIDAGEKGYLRASIGMVKENTVLRMVFPNCWEEQKEFDFQNEKNITILELSARAYLLSVIFQKDINELVLNKDVKKMNEMGNTIKELMENLGCTYVTGSHSESLSSAVMWLNSLYNFYRLGLSKQKEGKKPIVHISW